MRALTRKAKPAVRPSQTGAAGRVPSPRSRRRVVVGVVLIGVALAVGVGWYTWPRNPPPPVPPTLELTGIDPDAAGAIRAARTQVEQQPRSAAAWGKLGMILFAHDFHAEALSCLAQAENLDGADPRWPYFAGMIQTSDFTNPDAASACLRQAVERAGNDVTPQLRLAEVLLAQDQSEEAERHFRRVLELHPGNPRAELGLGQVAYQRDDLRGSLPYLKRAAASAYARRTARGLLAAVYQRLGDETAAARESYQAARLPPDSAWPDPWMEQVHELQTGLHARLSRGERLFLQGETKEGLAVLQETVQKHPEADRVHLFLGRAYFRLHELPAAVRALREAVRLAPDNVEAWFLLASALYHQKNYSAAIECFRQTAQIKPDHALAHYNLAQCLLTQGERQAAIEALRAALRTMPNLAEAHATLGELLARAGRDAEAFDHLRHAVRLDPSDARAQKVLEEVQARRPARPIP